MERLTRLLAQYFMMIQENADRTCSRMAIGLHRMRTSDLDQNLLFKPGAENAGLLQPELRRGAGSKQWVTGTRITATQSKSNGRKSRTEQGVVRVFQKQRHMYWVKAWNDPPAGKIIRGGH